MYNLPDQLVARFSGLLEDVERLPPATDLQIAASLRVIEVDPQQDPRWEAFVSAHPDGLIYHHPLWLQILQVTYDCTPVGLACEDGTGNLRGILPLCWTWGLLTGRRLASVPHTPVAGPLALDDHAAAALLCAAVERVRAHPGAHLQLKVPSLALDGIVEGVVAIPWQQSYVLELPEHPEQLKFGDARNHGTIRRAVHKAAREGIEVRPAETEGELRAWYELYLETMHWHTTPPRPYRLFKTAWELLQPRGLMRLLLAEHCQGGSRKLVAGSVFLMFGQTVFYAKSGRRLESLVLRPNDAIHWQAIHEACQAGYRRYDLGEVEEKNVGLAKFKEKWGGEQRWLYRYYYPVPSRSDAELVSGRGPARRLADAAWRRLPLKATAVLGYWIYKYL